jgi:hypothetical protein
VAEAHREVEAVGHQVAQVVAGAQLEFELRVRVEEAAQRGPRIRREKNGSMLTHRRPMAASAWPRASAVALSRAPSSGITGS